LSALHNASSGKRYKSAAAVFLPDVWCLSQHESQRYSTHTEGTTLGIINIHTPALHFIIALSKELSAMSERDGEHCAIRFKVQGRPQKATL
jgi:hypothetical protein